jgi:uncharacterized protein (DUF1015 family)
VILRFVYTGRVVAVAPFEGLLYDPARVGDLAAVTSPPYDVVLPHDRDRLHQASPHNIARVDLGHDLPGGDKYTDAARVLRSWRDEGILISTDGPRVYPYEMRFAYLGTERRVRGVIVEVVLEPWGRGVLPHERTMAAPVEDRLRLLRASMADLSPIYAVAGGPSPAQSEILDAVAGRTPRRELVDEEGTVHRLWVERMPEELAAWYVDQTLLVADGHHRYQTALAHQAEQRAARGSGPWDGVMMLIVDAAAEDPPVLPIHRLVRGNRPAFDGERVRGLEEILLRLTHDDLQFGAAWREEGGLVHVIARLGGEPPTVAALHRSLLDGLEAELRFVPDAALAEAAIRDGLADVALFLPPARVADVRGLVARGERLPQKSTYFWPKPRTGMVLRPLKGPVKAGS